MAKKKEPSIQDGLKVFKDVTRRASLSDYSNVENVLLSKNARDHSILIIPEVALWNAILDDPELKEHIKPLDLTNPAEKALEILFQFGTGLDDESWVDIDADILFSGKIFKITIHGFEYEVPINKNCLPIQLRKAEYNNIKFKVFTKPYNVLAIKKYFPFPVEGAGFTMMRLFQVI